VTNCLRALGLAEHPGSTAFHRVLNRNAWSGLALARTLLRRTVEGIRRSCPSSAVGRVSLGIPEKGGKRSLLNPEIVRKQEAGVWKSPLHTLRRLHLYLRGDRVRIIERRDPHLYHSHLLKMRVREE
jgi:hypothetical protein